MIGTAYTNKMHILFNILTNKNFIVKHAWYGVVFEYVTFWKVSRKMCEDKIYWKDLYWFVVSVGNPESRINLYIIPPSLALVRNKILPSRSRWKNQSNYVINQNTKNHFTISRLLNLKWKLVHLKPLYEENGSITKKTKKIKLF